MNLLNRISEKLRYALFNGREFETYLESELVDEVKFIERLLNIRNAQTALEGDLSFLPSVANREECEDVEWHLSYLRRKYSTGCQSPYWRQELPIDLKERFNEKYAKIYRLLELGKYNANKR